MSSDYLNAVVHASLFLIRTRLNDTHRTDNTAWAEVQTIYYMY